MSKRSCVFTRISTMLLGSLLASCRGSSTDPLVGPRFAVHTSTETVASGRSVTITFSNLRNSDTLFDHCPRTLERRDRSGWNVASTDFACDAVLSRLAPGRSFVATVAMPVASNGVYRLRFDVRDTGQTLLRESDRLSNVFSIK